jgi:hypothetical protein
VAAKLSLGVGDDRNFEVYACFMYVLWRLYDTFVMVVYFVFVTSRCISGAIALRILARFANLQMAAHPFLKINSVLHPVFDEHLWTGAR